MSSDDTQASLISFAAREANQKIVQASQPLPFRGTFCSVNCMCDGSASWRNQSMERSELLVDHYQKTYELTFELWKQRNTTFLVLLGVIGAATLLTFGAADANTLLIAWIANVLGM